MHCYYSVFALYNPVSPPRTSRLLKRLPPISGNAVGSSYDSHHHSGSPVRHDSRYKLFLSCPLSACKDDHSTNSLRRERTVLRIPMPLAKPMKRGK